MHPKTTASFFEFLFRFSSELFVDQISEQPQWEMVVTNFFSEVTLRYRNWAAQTFRILNGTNNFEIESTVGPIDISDEQGKEVISRFSTNLASNKTWFSDSNGLEMQERRLNFRFQFDALIQEPVSGNYVPITNMIHIQDLDQDLQMGLLIDRARGGSSLIDGQLETMVSSSFKQCFKNILS